MIAWGMKAMNKGTVVWEEDTSADFINCWYKGKRPFSWHQAYWAYDASNHSFIDQHWVGDVVNIMPVTFTISSPHLLVPTF